MPDNKTYIAVLDIGKTNKKILIFDQSLNLKTSAYDKFPEVEKDGVNYEQPEQVFDWFVTQLAEMSNQYNIRAISITTHGATAVCIDEDGDLTVPPVAYTTDGGEAFRKRFFDTFGDPATLQAETATAEIGSMVNLAKLLYFCKEKWPEQFDQTKHVLNYPQYFGFKLTGKSGAEPTYTGCHTYLYNAKEQAYSHVAKALGVADKLPQTISKSWETLGRVSPEIAAKTGLSEDCLVTMGIHDSNASLLPYLVKGFDNFVLNSTGTWCVAMHPCKQIHFEKDELGKLVFYNLDAFFNPVKTSIFMGGEEFGTYMDILAEIHGELDYDIPIETERYNQILEDADLFVLPSVVKGTGIFPHARPRVIENGREYPLEQIKEGTAIPEFFKDYPTALAVLTLSLALQTKSAMNLVGFDGPGRIFTEGGFRKNSHYNRVLSAFYPDATVGTTELPEATAFGAAMLGKAALEGSDPYVAEDCFEIELNPVSPLSLKNTSGYEQKFFDLVFDVDL